MTARRNLLRIGAAAVAAGAIRPALAAGGDAELIRLVDEIMANYAEENRLSAEAESAGVDWMRLRQEVTDPMVRACWDRRARLAKMPATTLAGFRAKARVLQEFNNCAPGYADPYDDDAIIWSLANDLLGVASVWRTEDDEEPAAADAGTKAQAA